MGELEKVLAILRTLAIVFPPLAAWLDEVTRDRDDEMSVRVRDILPGRSLSREAAEHLRRGG